MAEREHGVGWAKEAPIGKEFERPDFLTTSPLVGVPGAPSIEDRLFLALRQCATHPAGPLAAVAALEALPLHVDAERILATVRQRFEEMSMPDDRRAVGVTFLDVLERAYSGDPLPGR